MTSLSFVGRKRIFLALAIVLAFLAISLPQTNQAQQGWYGEVVKEVEPNEGTTTGPAQRIPFPSVVHGNRGGEMFPAYLVFPEDIPPIVSPFTGDIVGVPRQTQIIVFINAFVDGTDLYRFTLAEDTDVAINLEATCGAHYMSADAQSAVWGGILGMVQAPEDLDLLLYDRRGNLIDGSFNGPGFCLTFDAFNTPGCNCVPTTEFIPNDTNPGALFSGQTLPRGQYLVNVDDYVGFTIFLLDEGADQNTLTNNLITAWEGNTDNRYILRLGDRGISGPGGQRPPESVVPPKGSVKFEYGFSPARKIANAASDYYPLQVATPGTYTFNLSMGASRAGDVGRMSLLRFNGTRWVPVGRSVVAGKNRESLANVKLDAGRYMITMQRDGIKPISNKFNYSVAVVDETDQVVALQVNKVMPTVEQIRDRLASLANSGNGGSRGEPPK